MSGNQVKKGVEHYIRPREAARLLNEYLPIVGRTWRNPHTLALHTRPPRHGWTPIEFSDANFDEVLSPPDNIFVGRHCSGTSSDTMRMEYQTAPGYNHWRVDGSLPSVPHLHATASHVGVGLYDPTEEEAVLLRLNNGALGVAHWEEATGTFTPITTGEGIEGANGVPIQFRLQVVDLAGSLFATLSISSFGAGVPVGSTDGFTAVGSPINLTTSYSMADPRPCWFFQQGAASGTNRFAVLWDMADPVEIIL